MTDPVARTASTIESVFAEIRWWHETHATSLRERLEVAGITGLHREQIETVWERVIATQQNVLLRLAGTPISAGKPASLRSYPASTGALDNPVPTRAQLAILNRRELRHVAEACRRGIADCDWALSTLNTPLGPIDYWLEADSPSHALSRFRDWFSATRRNATRPAPHEEGR